MSHGLQRIHGVPVPANSSLGQSHAGYPVPLEEPHMDWLAPQAAPAHRYPQHPAWYAPPPPPPILPPPPRGSPPPCMNASNGAWGGADLVFSSLLMMAFFRDWMVT